MKYVYLLRAGEDRYKLGIASSVSKRVATLQTGNPYFVEIVCCRLVEKPREVEATLHKYLSAYKSDGGSEWFHLTPDQALDVCVQLNVYPEAIYPSLLSVRTMLEGSLQANSRNSALIRELLDELSTNVAVQEASARHEVTGFEQRAMEIFAATGRASASLLQRKLGIGYTKASRIVDELEARGLIGPADGAKPRKILDGAG